MNIQNPFSIHYIFNDQVWMQIDVQKDEEVYLYFSQNLNIDKENLIILINGNALSRSWTFYQINYYYPNSKYYIYNFIEIIQQKKFAENNLQHEKSKNKSLQGEIGEKILEIDKLSLQINQLTKTVNQKQQNIKQLHETMSVYLEFRKKICLLFNVAEQTNNLILLLQKLYDYIQNDRKQIKQYTTPQNRQSLRIFQTQLFNNTIICQQDQDEELDQSLTICNEKINCIFCNKDVNQETYFQLKCHHNYHRNCFDIMLQKLINTQNLNPVCVCMKRISLKCIQNFNSTYLQQFLHLQLLEIKKKYQQNIVTCNSCAFCYIKEKLDLSQDYCPYC